MRSRLLVAALVLITAAYCWGLGWIAWGFVRVGGVIGWGLAVGILALLVVTVWAVWREIVFGLQSARLARMYMPPVGAPTATDGTAPDRRTAAREEFEAARGALEDSPGATEDWAAWYRLALAYDANRDRRHARANVRRAIAIEHRTRAA
jgi:hypothetical protein